jgi:hypothetical protein
MVMRGKALCEMNVHRLQFVFAAILVPSVVSLTSRKNRQARIQQNLENLAAIVLEDVVDPMGGSQLLELSDSW